MRIRRLWALISALALLAALLPAGAAGAAATVTGAGTAGTAVAASGDAWQQPPRRPLRTGQKQWPPAGAVQPAAATPAAAAPARPVPPDPLAPQPQVPVRSVPAVRAANAGVNVLLLDASGAPFDLLAAGATYSATVRVTDAAGAPVAGAAVRLDGAALGQTGPDGTLPVALSYPDERFAYLEASATLADGTPTTGAVELAVLNPNSAVLEIDAVDESGARLPNLAVAGYQPEPGSNWATYPVWHGFSDGGNLHVIVPAGDYTLAAVSEKAGGPAYYLTLNESLAPFVRHRVTASARDTVPLTVQAQVGTSPVAGTGIFLSPSAPRLSPPFPTTVTGRDGRKTIMVRPAAAYDAGLLGNGVLGFIGGSPVGAAGGQVSFLFDPATAARLNLQVQPPASGAAVSQPRLWVWGDGGMQLEGAVEGSYLVLPGTYSLASTFGVEAASGSWLYSFRYQGGLDPWWNHFDASLTYDFVIGGALNPLLEVQPAQPAPDSEVWLDMQLASATSRLDHIEVCSAGGCNGVRPTLTLREGDEWNPGATLLSGVGGTWWIAGPAGAYTLYGEYPADLGPYVGPDTPRRGQRTFRVSSSSSISVAVTDPAGDPADRVIPADGNTYPVTVAVSDAAGAVSGAEIRRNGTSVAVTDAAGRAVLSLGSGDNEMAYFEVQTADGRHAWFSVAMAASGFGVVDVTARDRAGERLHHFELILAPDMASGASMTPIEGWDGEGAWFAPAGTWPAYLLGDTGTSVGYHLALGNVAVAAGSRTRVTADAAAMPGLQPLTLEARAGQAPVAGARVWIGSPAEALWHWHPEAVTGPDGKATVYVVPAPGQTYVAGLLGGTPAVLGVVPDLVPGVPASVIDFSGGGQLDFTAADGAGNPVGGELLASVPDQPPFTLHAGAPGRYLVYPGSYELWGNLSLSDGQATWHYDFSTTHPAGTDPWAPVRFAPGEARSFAIGGAGLTAAIIGPDRVAVGSPAWHQFAVENATARLTNIFWWNSTINIGENANPQLQVLDQNGSPVPVEAYGWGVEWQAAAGGSYTVTGTLTGAGPLFPAGAALTASLPVTAAEAAHYEYSISPPWVNHAAGTPIQVQVRKNGTPLAGAVLQLPPGSTAPDGTPVTSVTTGPDGSAAFALHVPHGGVWQIFVSDGPEQSRFPVLVTDARFGVLQVGATENGTPLAAGALPVKILPRQADGSYGSPAGARGVAPGFYLLPAGEYGVVMAPPGYYLTRSGVIITGNAQTDAVVEVAGAGLSPVSYRASLTDGTAALTVDAAAATSREFGPHSGLPVPIDAGGGGSFLASPGIYGLAFHASSAATAAAPRRSFILIQDQVAPGGAPVTLQRQVSDLGALTPAVTTAAAAPASLRLSVQSADAAATWSMGPGEEAYLIPGNYRVFQWDAAIPAGSGEWRYHFSADRAITVARGANPTLLQDLGGALTPRLAVAPAAGTAVVPGSSLQVEFLLTTAAGDRLRAVQAPESDVPLPVWLALYRRISDTAHEFVAEWHVDGSGPATVTLPPQLPAGAYTLKAMWPVGPYTSTGSYQATAELAIEVNGLQGTVRRDGWSPIPPTVVVTNGIEEGQPGAYHRTIMAVPTQDPHVFTWVADNPPAGTYQIVAMAPSLLMATARVNVSGGGAVTAPDLLLHFGDLDADHSINRADLNLLADHYRQMNPYSWMADGVPDGRIDLLDLALAARNQGKEANLSVPGLGSIAVTVHSDNPAALPPQALLTIARRWTDTGEIPVMHRLVNLNRSGDTPLVVAGLPAGAYVVHLEELGAAGWVLVPADGTGSVLLTPGVRNGDQPGSVTAQVVDATTGSPLAGAEVVLVRDGLSSPALTSGADGRVTFAGVAPGIYQVRASLGGYLTASTAVEVAPGAAVNTVVALPPQAQNGTARLRVVLTWGAEPADLDSHLLVPAVDSNGGYEVYYSAPGSLAAYPHAELDVDDTTSYGPETVTISTLHPGKYRYLVHDYTNEDNAADPYLAGSGAQVQVFGENGLLHSFAVPAGTGPWWHVFDVDVAADGTYTITPVNQIGAQKPALAGIRTAEYPAKQR